MSLLLEVASARSDRDDRPASNDRCGRARPHMAINIATERRGPAVLNCMHATWPYMYEVTPSDDVHVSEDDDPSSATNTTTVSWRLGLDLGL